MRKLDTNCVDYSSVMCYNDSGDTVKYNVFMERSQEQQRHILMALEERDIRTVRNVGQALCLTSPTSLKREELLGSIAHALREGAQSSPTTPRLGRPSHGGKEGAEILRRLDQEYLQSKIVPLRTLAGRQQRYDVPSDSLVPGHAKSWSKDILKGQRALLYCINGNVLRSNLFGLLEYAVKLGIRCKAIVCDVPPEETQAIAKDVAGDVVVTHFGMTRAMQTEQIVAQISAFLEFDGDKLLIIEDMAKLANVAVSGVHSSEDATRILVSLAASCGTDGSLTLVGGTSNDEFFRAYQMLFNHNIRL